MQILTDQFRACLKDKKLTDYEIQLLRKCVNFNEFSAEHSRKAMLSVLSEHAGEFDGAGLMLWVEGIDKVLSDTSKYNGPKVCFSPEMDCVELIQDFLKSAQSTIDICVYTISDDRISELLMGLHRAGRNIRIITDDQKKDDAGSDIRRLHKKGVPVKEDLSQSFMHHKFAIIDKTALMTGSYNWTRGAADRNYENLIYTENLELVNPFVAEFERLWIHDKIKDMQN